MIEGIVVSRLIRVVKGCVSCWGVYCVRNSAMSMFIGIVSSIVKVEEIMVI